MSSTPSLCEDTCLSLLKDSIEGPNTASSECCYPISSSTVLSSSPSLQTPLEEIAQQGSLSTRSTSRCYPKETIKASELRTGMLYAVHGEPTHMFHYLCINNLLLAGNRSNTTSSSSSSYSDDSEELLEAVQKTKYPRFYSLNSRAAQLGFAQELDNLLLAVLRNQDRIRNEALHSSRATPAVICTERSIYAPSLSLSGGLGISPTRSADMVARTQSPPFGNVKDDNNSASLATSPMKGSISPPVYAHSFDFVNVDEYNDHSQPWNNTSCSYESVTSSHASHSKFSTTTTCDSPKVPLVVCTPFPVAATSVPPAPKKVLRQFRFSGPSRVGSPHSTTRSQVSKRSSQPPDVPHSSNADHTLSDSCSQTGKICEILQLCTTPPQVDIPVNDSDQPLTKRPKLSSVSSNSVQERQTRTLASRFLEKEPASCRRAASLRSELSVSDILDIPKIPTNGIVMSSPLDHSGSNGGHSLAAETESAVACPPTELSSPSTDSYNSVSRSDSLLPLIAPPVFELIPRAPLTKTESAEHRISTLRHKDRHERQADGLFVHSTSVLPRNEDQNMTNVASQSGEGQDTGLSPSPTTEDGDEEQILKLGIQEHFRMKVVQWMLDVCPRYQGD
jgi:hypothetical protein